MANRRCAYCGSDGPLTLEHLWPTSLHRRLIDASDDKDNQFWLRRLGREIEGEPKLRDVCAKCNNICLSRLDAYICELFDKYFVQMLDRHQRIVFEFDYHILKRWLLKMCFNSARIHSSIDLFVFQPLLPYITGQSHAAGRSVTLYAQLSYPGEIPASMLVEPTGGPVIFRPTSHRVGNAWFAAPGIGRKLLRAVHLRAFSFFLAFFDPEKGGTEAQDFSDVFLRNQRASAMLRASQNRTELVCDGSDAWESWFSARENTLVEGLGI